MDIQSAPPPSAATPNMSVVGVPPQLGAPVPGATGGLPALSGLSVAKNPMAEALRSKGRGEDTMLVHMTPNEVNSLQGLAMAAGGSLTINPETGLPEAGWLGKLLPTLLGGLGMAFGIPPVWMGALGAVGGTIATGDLGKGLSMGLQAYGGASMAGGLGLAGKINPNAFGLLGNAGSGVAQAAAAPITNAAEQVAQGTSNQLANIGAQVGKLDPGLGLGSMGSGSMGMGMNVPVTDMSRSAINAVGKKGLAGFAQGFGDAAKMGLPRGILTQAAPALAAKGVMGGVSEAMAPSGGFTTSDGKIDNSYQGPYYSPKRRVVSNATTESILKGSGEQQRWFDVGIPEVYNVQGQLVQPGSNTAKGTPILQNVLNPKAKEGEPMYSFRQVPFMMSPEEQQMAALYPNLYGRGMGLGFAKGGEVEMDDGAFVVDARTVSELGNGSSEAGQELLAKLGGRPIKGPGDGVSDSIPAKIGDDQPARVARDEVLFSAEAVKKLGKGSEKRGAQKLYALMDKAHKARRESARGKDTGLRKGLA